VCSAIEATELRKPMAGLLELMPVATGLGEAGRADLRHARRDLLAALTDSVDRRR